MAKLRSKEVSARLLASCHTAGEISGWDGRPRLDKDERKIVHGHLHDLAQFKAVGRGFADAATNPTIAAGIQGHEACRYLFPQSRDEPNPAALQSAIQAGNRGTSAVRAVVPRRHEPSSRRHSISAVD